MSRILIASDAWHPQINGVVRTLERLSRHLPEFGAEATMLTPEGYRTVPCPTYPEIRLTIAAPGAIGRRLDEAADLFDPARRSEILDLPRPIFLYVGRVAVEKNIGAFLDLDLPGSKVVVGDGPALETLKRAHPKVSFLGAKVGEALANVYAASDCFVFPSRTDT